MTHPVEGPLGAIEMGFTLEQAAAIVAEFDALYAHSNVMGKKRVKVLYLFRASLVAALTAPDEPVKVGGTT
jgi:hypothetical protein